jgi:hypothetical protein
MANPTISFEVQEAGERPILYLHMNWIDGENEELSFVVDTGAGCGNAALGLVIKKGDQRWYELVDIRQGVQDWVRAALGRMEAFQAAQAPEASPSASEGL